MTLEQLRRESGYSERTLKRYFHLCLIIYRDNTIKFTQLYRLTNGEWYEELKEDLENLINLGVKIESITCDGHRALLKAIKKVCKHVLTQRCVVHIQRMCRIWLSSKPKSEAGIQLYLIISKVHLIKTIVERDYWIVDLIHWYEKYEDYINEKSFNLVTGRYWFKHKMLKRSFMVIKKALPNMFHYLDNPMIPKSTNGLESFFGHLKGNLNIHRGLSKEHRKNFIRWYLFFKNPIGKGFQSKKHKE